MEDGEVVTSIAIAEKEGISSGVLIRLLRKLSDAGILKSHQGRGSICGGFSLVKSIDEISFFDIIQLLEDVEIDINLGEELRKKETHLSDKCHQINEYLKEELSKYTIRVLFGL